MDRALGAGASQGAMGKLHIRTGNLQGATGAQSFPLQFPSCSSGPPCRTTGPVGALCLWAGCRAEERAGTSDVPCESRPPYLRSFQIVFVFRDLLQLASMSEWLAKLIYTVYFCQKFIRHILVWLQLSPQFATV